MHLWNFMSFLIIIIIIIISIFRFFLSFFITSSHDLMRGINEPCREKTGLFAYVKTKTQISLAVTAKLISVFVFATRILQSLYFLNTKFQASRHLLWLYSLVYVDLVGNPEDQFSHNEAQIRKKGWEALIMSTLKSIHTA